MISQLYDETAILIQYRRLIDFFRLYIPEVMLYCISIYCHFHMVSRYLHLTVVSPVLFQNHLHHPYATGEPAYHAVQSGRALPTIYNQAQTVVLIPHGEIQVQRS